MGGGSLENFLAAHVRASQDLGRLYRQTLYHKLKGVVLGHYAELASIPNCLSSRAHSRFPEPCHPYRGNKLPDEAGLTAERQLDLLERLRDRLTKDADRV